MEVIREKCTGCQTDEPNQLAHDLFLFASAEEQVNLCFEEVYGRVHWEDVMDCQESTRNANSFKSRDINYFQRNC